MLFLCLIMMLMAFYGLYLLSEKQIQKFPYLIQKSSLYRWICIMTCLLSMLGLMKIYSLSIGFVIWWIYATPLLFLIILWVNLYKKPKNR